MSSSGHRDRHQPRQAGVLAHRHDDAADREHRGGDHERRRHLHEQLHLLHVVRVAGDERRGAELADLALREGHHAVEEVAAQIAAHPHREPGAEVHRDDRADDLHEADDQHHAAGRPDVGDVALDDAVVDDVGVERRQHAATRSTARAGTRPPRERAATPEPGSARGACRARSVLSAGSARDAVEDELDDFVVVQSGCADGGWGRMPRSRRSAGARDLLGRDAERVRHPGRRPRRSPPRTRRSARGRRIRRPRCDRAATASRRRPGRDRARRARSGRPSSRAEATGRRSLSPACASARSKNARTDARTRVSLSPNARKIVPSAMPRCSASCRVVSELPNSMNSGIACSAIMARRSSGVIGCARWRASGAASDRVELRSRGRV